MNENNEKFEYNSFAETIGEMVGSFFKAVWTFISTVFIDMIHLIGAFFVFAKQWIKTTFGGSVRSFREEVHNYKFIDYVNLALPVCGFVLLIATITHFSTTTFAIEVDSSGQSVGYVADEAVYNEAQSLVKERFSTDLSDKSNVEGLSTSYKIVEANPTELLDSDTISDNMVESTNADSTYACGVYIDGEFICALKTETDAMQVFNNIIDSYEKDSENETVGFVQDVQYIQGIYPNNEETIWDSEKLASELTKTRHKEKRYTVKDGDTLANIAYSNGISVTELLELNPELGDTIHVGDEVLISGEVNYVTMKVVKTVVKNVEIPYETVKTNSSNYYQGTTKTTQKGRSGLDQVTYMITYVDGVQVSTQEVNRTTLRQPTTEKILVGTKVATVKKTNYGAYTPSTYVRGYGKLIWPAPGVYKVSSPYGPRWGSFHGGIDLSVGSYGSTIVAAASGTVITATNASSGYGTHVMIDHGNGMTTVYAHMIYGSLAVHVGQHVSGGQPLGKMGATGFATGPHLHFEVRINGTKVNPAPYIGA